MFRFTEECAVGCLALSIPQIAIERSFATVFRSTYESYGSRLGIMMTVKTYIGAILFSSSLFIYQIFIVKDFKFDEIHSTCRLEAFSSLLPLYFGVWFTAIFITIASTGIMFVAYNFNRKEHQRKRSLHLSLRYQFQENVKTLRSLIPPITAFLCCDLLGVGCILYVIFHDDLPDRQVAIALQVIHIIPQGYCIFTVSWFMYSFSAVRQRVKEDLQCLLPKGARSNRIKNGELNSIGIQMHSTQDDHFSSLVDSWDLKFVDRIGK
ncbi:G protein-coupled receptor [Aphelenchoides besseyi]|nr:G protein-coupled receptor [Aphelenchoides besseyi]